MTRPRGKPPIPSAISRPSEPVETASASTAVSRCPRRMIEPLPKARSICESAASNALFLSISSLSANLTTFSDIAVSPLRSYRDDCQIFRSRAVMALVRGAEYTRFVLSVKKIDQNENTRNFHRYIRRLVRYPLAFAMRFQHFLHLGGELLQGEGLQQEVHFLAGVDSAAERVLGIAGDEDDRQVGATRAHLFHHRGAVDARHHHVADDEVDLGEMLAADFERRLARARLQHVIALVAQSACAEQAHSVLVLDQQDGADAGQVAHRFFLAVDALHAAGFGLVLRQVDAEDRALAHRAV